MKYALLICLVIVSGCASPKPDPTAKQQATLQWNVTRATVLQSLARDQYATGNFDKCRQTLTDVLRMDPGSSNAHLLSAKLYIEQGQLELAERDLNVSRSIDVNLAEADYLSGVIYQRWQQPARALDFYQSASAKSPAELAYVMARGETLVAMDRQAEALALLSEKVNYFEHSPVIRDAVGMLLLQQRKPDQAVEMLRRATILAPDDLSVREHLALALYEDKQYAAGEDMLARLLKEPTLSERTDLFLMLAQCRLQLGKPAEARTSLETACDLSPSNASAWLELARTCMSIGDTRRAQISLNRAVALNSENSEAFLLQGYLDLRQHHMTEALAAFKQSSELDQDDTVSLCMVGYTLGQMSEPKESLRYYGQALKKNPGDDMAKALMADVGE